MSVQGPVSSGLPRAGLGAGLFNRSVRGCSVSTMVADCPGTIGDRRVAWVIPKLTAGGVGPVCRYAAEALACLPGWRCSVVSLHDPPGSEPVAPSPAAYATLGLGADAPCGFLRWLRSHPQDVVISNDVSHIEAAFPYLPPETLHVVQVHDSLYRYRAVAVRNQAWIDGVSCVARHIEDNLRPELMVTGFRGVVGTCHNGAAFPPPPERKRPGCPLNLLFMGKADPLLKGVLDLLPILTRAVKMELPVHLTIVGGHHGRLKRGFARRDLARHVTWTGRVPHAECYRIAADCDVFLMLSRREPFGMVTIEAMSMGCVPIAYDVPSGTREIIEHDTNGILVPLGDWFAIARAIRELHLDRERWLLLSNGAMNRARAQFGATALANRTDQFLRRVQDNARSAPSVRRPGIPGTGESARRARSISYSRLPFGLRTRLRDLAGRSPRISHWLLKHWKL